MFVSTSGPFSKKNLTGSKAWENKTKEIALRLRDESWLPLFCSPKPSSQVGINILQMAYWALIGAIGLAELCLYAPTVSVCGRWGEVDNLKGWGTESMVTMMAKMMPWKITDLHFTYEFCIVQFQKISFFGVGVLQHQIISGGSKLCSALKKFWRIIRNTLYHSMLQTWWQKMPNHWWSCCYHAVQKVTIW